MSRGSWATRIAGFAGLVVLGSAAACVHGSQEVTARASAQAPPRDAAVQADRGNPAATAQAQAAGKAIFQKKGNCATCHGREGKGTPVGPDLTDGQWIDISGSLESIQMVIRSGVTRPKQYPAPMPPMGGARLSDAEVAAVAQYVFELNPKAPE